LKYDGILKSGGVTQMQKRILAVDERSDLCNLVKVVLEDDGYEVLLRGTPFRNIAEIEALHPDLILLAPRDVVDCVGRQTLHLLRHHSIPILVLVREPEYVLEQDRECAGKHTTFTQSPGNIDDLIAVVQRALI
jgi:DNA-binding NtrC family response regulator